MATTPSQSWDEFVKSLEPGLRLALKPFVEAVGEKLKTSGTLTDQELDALFNQKVSLKPQNNFKETFDEWYKNNLDEVQKRLKLEHPQRVYEPDPQQQVDLEVGPELSRQAYAAQPAWLKIADPAYDPKAARDNSIRQALRDASRSPAEFQTQFQGKVAEAEAKFRAELALRNKLKMPTPSPSKKLKPEPY